MSSSFQTVPLSERELKLLQTLVYDHSGMFFDDRRTHFLQDRLQRRLRACQLDSFHSYYQLLKGHSGNAELSALIEILAINETSFFRNKPQLELFRSGVLEELLARKAQRAEYSLRIWSAGCSTGQEPYTLAMLCCDALAFFAMRQPLAPTPHGQRPIVPTPWKLEIVASDISYSALRTAQQGFYTSQQMETVDFMYRLRYFDRVDEGYRVKPELKSVIQFDFHNLKSEFLPRGNDVIFCRNVMIYFDEAEQKRLVNKFHRCLTPHGYLLLGHAETLLGLNDRFAIVHHDQGTAYQRREEES